MIITSAVHNASDILRDTQCMHAVCKHFKLRQNPGIWSLILHHVAFVMTTLMEVENVNFKGYDFVTSMFIIPFSSLAMMQLLTRQRLQPGILVCMERCRKQFFAKSKQHVIVYEWFAFASHVYPSTTWPCFCSIVTSNAWICCISLWNLSIRLMKRKWKVSIFLHKRCLI